MKCILARCSFTIAVMGIYMTQGHMNLHETLRVFSKKSYMNVNDTNGNISLFSVHKNMTELATTNRATVAVETTTKATTATTNRTTVAAESIKTTTNRTTSPAETTIKTTTTATTNRATSIPETTTKTTNNTTKITESTAIRPSSPKRLDVILKSGERSALYLSNFTNFKVNDNIPEIENGSKYNVGLYSVVVNQFTGYPMGKDFHLQPWADFRHFRHFIESVQQGRILICFLRKDLTLKIPNEIVNYLKEEGSLFVEFLGPGVTWAWAWIKGGRTIAEGLSSPTSQDMAPRHLISMEIDLKEAANTEICPEWPANHHWQKRREFCSKYERYGDLCACKNPYSLAMTQEKILGSVIENAVVVMLAYRVPDLYRTLKSLASATGFNKSRIEVYTQNEHPQLAEFLDLAGISLTVTHQSHEFISTLIARQLVFALNHTLYKHQDADYIIFMEEDLRVSPDFFIFLNRSASLLRDDPSLYCASAHNDLSYPHTSYDPRAVLRTESYPNYGWMVNRNFAVEMVTTMSALEREYDWDVVTYYHIRRGRECIIPEVSRSKHNTRGGSHFTQWEARKFFSNKHFNDDPNATVEKIESLQNETYESFITSKLEKARFINASEVSPCRDDFYSLFTMTEEEEKALVLFFSTEGNIDYFRINIQWKILADCLGTFSLESREGHHGLYRMRYGAAHFFLIAYPASPYRRYKPADIGVFNASAEERSYARHRSRPKELSYNLQLPKQIFGEKYPGSVGNVT